MANLVFTPTLYPPIGHTTTCYVERGTVEFQCLMELSCDEGVVPSPELLQPGRHFTVLLWWSVEGRGEWSPAAFGRGDGTNGGTAVQHYYKDKANTKRYEAFTLHLPYPTTKPLQFCLKYRFGDGPWLWSGSRIGGVDGRIVFLSPQPPMSLGQASQDERSRLSLQFDDIFEPESKQDTRALFDVTAVDENSSQEELNLLNLLNIGVWRVTSPLSRIFGGSGDISKNEGGNKQVAELFLGKVAFLERWMALVKIASPWMGPIHSGSAAGGGGGESAFTTTKECLLLLMQRRDGLQVAILPLSGIPSGGGTSTASSYVTSHVGNHEWGEKGVDGVIWRVYDESPTGGGRLGSATCIVAVGMDARSVVKGVMSWAEFIVKKTSILGITPGIGQSMVPKNREEGLSSGLAISNDKLYHFHAGLSYCTWNSLGANLSGERVLDALQDLHESGIKVCNIIIDDNWQTLVGYLPPIASFTEVNPANGNSPGVQGNAEYTSSGTWTAFHANPNFKPVGGLPGLVKRIRNQYPNIQNIGVWHALHGYWDGITPGGEIDSAYKTVDCIWKDNVHQQERRLRFIDPIDIERFYDDFYLYLSECGVRCVKVDVQCRINELKNGNDRGRLLPAYQRAFALSAQKYFQGRVIVCMAHIPQILQCSLLGNGLIRPLFRTSDDFYPNVPESHGWHIFANSMNMTMFSHLSIVPDWDMFQTALPRYASFHAAARCLSGGPVVITDTPGDHDIDLIQQMTAATPDGHSVTLRPTSMAAPSDPYVSYTSSKLLRITNTHLRGLSCEGSEVTSFLGFFNISPIYLRDLFRLSDFDGLREDSYYITRSYRSGHITSPVAQTEADDAFLTLHLEPGAWDILTAVPVTRLFDPSIGITCYVGTFGLSTNMTGAAAVTDTSVADMLDDNGNMCGVSVQYSLKALGTLLVYVSSTICNPCKRLQIEICGLPLHMDEGYWRIHPDHGDAVEVFIDKAYENLHARIRDSVPEKPLTVSVMLYGVERSPMRLDGA